MYIQIFYLCAGERDERKNLRVGWNHFRTRAVFSSQTAYVLKYDGGLLGVNRVERSFVPDVVLRDEGDLAPDEVVELCHVEWRVRRRRVPGSCPVTSTQTVEVRGLSSRAAVWYYYAATLPFSAVAATLPFSAVTVTATAAR